MKHLSNFFAKIKININRIINFICVNTKNVVNIISDSYILQLIIILVLTKNDFISGYEKKLDIGSLKDLDFEYPNISSNLNKVEFYYNIPVELNRNIYSNFNTHFPMYNSSVVTTLTIWQYWWWMSFIFIIVLFNRVVFKLFFENTLKLKPKVFTSIKSNGRWGDAIASLFPIFWCSNILVNSNLILKLIENHTESGLFLLRVRGKQWYWVYKLSLNLKHELNNSSIIIGRGNKINTTYFIKSRSIPHLNYKKNFIKKININIKQNEMLIFKINDFKFKKVSSLHLTKLDNVINNFKQINLDKLKIKGSYNLTRSVKANKSFYNSNSNRLILCKNEYNKSNKLFSFKRTLTHNYRPYNRHFFTIQQQPKTNWKFLKKNNIVKQNIVDPNVYNVKKTISTKLIPINNLNKKHILNKLRLISSRNTLILPIKTNITVITNSFDVVHSWFIPGLGLKFDCVPGRSTHYTLRINKPGIYIGHCAEVCGRFHHHMPIKIVAVPLNQFIYYYDMYFEIK